MAKSIFNIFLILLSLNAIAQSERIKNDSIGIKLISITGKYHLIITSNSINTDTIPFNIRQHSFFDSTVIDTCYISFRKLIDTTKKEIVLNYKYRQGDYYPGSNGYNEIYIIDFLSGDILFQHRTSEFHIYGVNWRQGFESCSLKHNVSLNENGEIIVENRITKSGLGDMPQTKNGKIKYNRKMILHFCFLPTMDIQKSGIYILTDGEYILRE